MSSSGLTRRPIAVPPKASVPTARLEPGPRDRVREGEQVLFLGSPLRISMGFNAAGSHAAIPEFSTPYVRLRWSACAPRMNRARTICAKRRLAHGLPVRACRRPDRLGGAADPDRNGGRPRHRQPHLHLDPHQQAARRTSRAGAPHRHRAGAGAAPGAAGHGRDHRAADRAGLQPSATASRGAT